MHSIADTLATITPVLLVPGNGRSDDGLIREALYCWAFRGMEDPPQEKATMTNRHRCIVLQRGHGGPQVVTGLLPG